MNSQKEVKKMCNGLNPLKMGSTDAHEKNIGFRNMYKTP